MTTKAERKASQWYMNRSPGSLTLPGLKLELAMLLEKTTLNEGELNQLEKSLTSLINQTCNGNEV